MYGLLKTMSRYDPCEYLDCEGFFEKGLLYKNKFYHLCKIHSEGIENGTIQAKFKNNKNPEFRPLGSRDPL